MQIKLNNEQLRQVLERIQKIELKLKLRGLEDIEKLMLMHELDKLNKLMETGILNVS